MRKQRGRLTSCANREEDKTTRRQQEEGDDEGSISPWKGLMVLRTGLAHPWRRERVADLGSHLVAQPRVQQAAD
eukprot:COSAG04_NODE_11187_length_725_cov_0.650160_1_plen_73_part_01